MIVLNAVMIYDRSIGTREARSGKVCIYFRIRGSDPRGACTAMALSCNKFENGGSAGQIRGFDPRVGRKQHAGRDGLTRE